MSQLIEDLYLEYRAKGFIQDENDILFAKVILEKYGSMPPEALEQAAANIVEAIRACSLDDAQLLRFLPYLNGGLKYMEEAAGVSLPSFTLADVLENMDTDRLLNAQESVGEDTLTTDEDKETAPAKDKKPAVLPKILVKNLQDMVRRLPIEEKKHLKRCRQIAQFIIEQIRSTDEFIDLEIDPNNLLNAVSFHDIGKIQCVDKGHVEAGLDLLQSLTSVPLSDYPENSREGILRDGIAGHHRKPFGAEETEEEATQRQTFAGKFTAFVNDVDNLFFRQQSTYSAIRDFATIIRQKSGKELDAEFSDVILQKAELFEKFANEVVNAEYRKKDIDVYGMEYEFSPFYDINTEDIVAYNTELYLNDPFYGRVKAGPIVGLMENSPHFPLFERLKAEHLCRLVGMSKRDLPHIVLPVSVKNLNKPAFLLSFYKMMLKHGNRYHQLILAVSEKEILDSGADAVNIVDKVHMVGAGFAISEFGGKVSLVPSLHEIRPDYLILRPEYATRITDSSYYWDNLLHILQVTTKYQISVFFTNVRTQTELGKIQQAGGTIVAGESLFPNMESSFTEKELEYREIE